uniref:peptidylprolyl isomerase n=1 Tax=Eutreptiella gymnastica TaxID=73025 RepID=A0A7S4G5K3_9EUGL
MADVKDMLDKVICAIHHLDDGDGCEAWAIAKCIKSEGKGWGGLRKALKRGVSKEYLLRKGDCYKINQSKLKAVTKQKKLEAEAKEPIESAAAHNPNKVFRKKGLEYKVLEPGRGATARNGCKVSVSYKGWVQKTNKTFDKGKMDFVVGDGDVIKGWDIGVEGMRQHEKRLLTIPPGLAYGKRGVEPDIPPKSTLIFDVYLAKVVDPRGADDSDN